MNEHLTIEEQATNFATMLHIARVRDLLGEVIVKLLERAASHDQSKLEHPEVELFSEYTAKLKTSTYGSPEYNQFLKEMKPALDHHYANNRHHPEHHKNGVDDMTLLDLIEMICDWKAASERHHNGCIGKSIEINGKRFDMNIQLIKIFENTAKEFDFN